MNSGSSSKTKRPDIDRNLLMKELKARIKELNALTKLHIRNKRYVEAGGTHGLWAAYEYISNRIERGIYDSTPKEDHGP